MEILSMKTTRDQSSDAFDEKPNVGMTRREAIRSIGGGTIGAALVGSLTEHSAGAQTHTTTQAMVGTLPFQGIRIVEKSQTLAGRLAGQMFADQGAEVFLERGAQPSPGGLDDAYFDRGKIALPPGGLADTSTADVIIVDGQAPVSRAPHQIVLRVVAALPGDQTYGHLAADCSEDLLNALVGFFTDMNVTGPMLGRPVIYSPLPLCSVYAGVNGSIATAAALVDRERTGQGREIIASRLAGGLSAIGALSLTSTGLPKHLQPVEIGGLPPGLSPEQFKVITAKASADPAQELWLMQRFGPLSAPYRASDGRFILPMAAPNRRLTRRLLEALGLWDKALAAGMVDVSSYDPANMADARRNLADSVALSFDLTSKLADMLTPVFVSRTAAQWDRYLKANGVASTVINTWEEWQRDSNARVARIFVAAVGHEDEQIGRASWVASAQPYPDVEAVRRADSIPPRTAPVPAATGEPNRLPLAGFTVLDLSNVIAGPACGRMFAELGANVINVVPMNPNHSPTIVVAWAGELAAGKRSIILNPSTEGGKEVLRRLAARADFVLANKLDDQMARMRLDPDSLATLNPPAIGLQVSAFRGEKRGPLQNDMGYDPSVQGTTGVMTRFGAEGAPTYNGIASCVDYLCGCLGIWAGAIALYARQHRRDGRGDWAETSLATAATLTQLLLQRKAEPATARGPHATGMNAGERVYQLSDGWIFAQGSSDLSSELASRTVADALAYLASKKINAVPVQTCRQMADLHRAKPTRTVHFERTEKDGWATECFAPSWFVFDNQPFSRSAPASRIGADGPAVLAELGYTPEEVNRLVSSGVVGRTEWAKS
jgi:crotonobetainyl-CoA:carnitine CoA-transferase CaiB-like acyl-CoA transferase